MQMWVPTLEALEVQQSKIRGVMQAAAAVSVKATHLLHLCRHKLLCTPETATVSSRYRH